MENVNLKQIWSIAYNWALIFTLRDKEAPNLASFQSALNELRPL